jgi:ribosomal protein S18 acetylase RimI-like enzyme
MVQRPTIPLTAVLVDLDSPVFEAVRSWSYADSFVGRILNDDIPQRVQYGNASIWAYADPDKRLVGFGVMDVCDDYSSLTGGTAHPHIPLLAVNQESQGKGHGNSIVKHLIGQAAICARRGWYNVVFLEVYTTSAAAISLYQKHLFEKVSEEPVYDTAEKQFYYIMGRQVSISDEMVT